MDATGVRSLCPAHSKSGRSRPTEMSASAPSLGKGGKTRSILSCAALLLRASLPRVMVTRPDRPLFCSQRDGLLAQAVPW